MNQVRRAGRQLKMLVLFILVLTPPLYLVLFLWQGPLAMLQLPLNLGYDLSAAGLPGTLVMFLLPTLTPLVYWWAFYLLYRLASQYAQGEVFLLSAVTRLRHLGLVLLLTDLVYMLQRMVTGPILTSLGITDGYIQLELKLSTSVVGLFIILISRVMVIASELNEQQRLTI